MTDASHEKAFAYCLRILKMRLWSRQEIADKLKARKYSPRVIDGVIRELDSSGYLDDERCAYAWVHDRMSLNPKAPWVLAVELKKKGISEATVDKVLGDIKNQFNFEEIALNLAEKKLKTYKKGLDKITIKRRLFDYLRRRGFSSAVIYDTLNKVLKKAP